LTKDESRNEITSGFDSSGSHLFSAMLIQEMTENAGAAVDHVWNKLFNEMFSRLKLQYFHSA